MKVISVLNMKGGVGKTTFAVNLAHGLSKAYNKKVALVDLDPQFNATQILMSGEQYIDHREKGKDTVLSLFERQSAVAPSIVSGDQKTEPKPFEDISLIGRSGVYFLPGNIELYRVEMSPGQGVEFGLKHFVDKNLKKLGFDIVIIDTPPTPSVWMTSALLASNHYIVPVKPEPLSMVGVDLLRNVIKSKEQAYNISVSCLGLVFSLVERPDSKSFLKSKRWAEQSTYWSKYVYSSYLSKRSAYARSQTQAPFILDTKIANFQGQLKAVTQEFIERLSR